MKFAAVVALLCVCQLACTLAKPYAEWQLFKSTHGRHYKDMAEEQYRYEVFTNNTEFIRKHNEAYSRGEVTFTLRMNRFGDMTREEIVKTMNNYDQTKKKPASKVFSKAELKSELLDEKDWRLDGAVTDVKDQKQCGSCWAFSATGSLEGQHFLKNFELVSLSEQNLVDCSTVEGNNGCNGGLMDLAFDYIKIHGVDTEISYPYTARDGRCKFSKQNVGATLTSYVDIPSRDEGELEAAVSSVGPVSVAIDASKSSFHFYDQGVYYDFLCSSSRLDHGVLAVGYGTEGTHNYWIVKNSWGMDWGMDGYINMSKDRRNNCGIATEASYPVV